MIKKILVTTFVILSIALNCQKKNISDEEIYEVINFVVKNGKTKFHKKLSIITEDPNLKTDKYIGKEFLRQYFNEKDSDYILSQFATSKDFLLSYKYITDLKIIHSEKLLAYKKLGKGFWSVFEEKHDDAGFMFVGKPLFSLDKKRVIINYGYYCGGLCGQGSRIILKKIKDKWVFEKEISGFIS
ncbi:hypothetical protein K0U91_14800 [Chryseobacterium chendengshani]|uniref:hypothetical protein n=1 Tax=Chryseobacterium sp. LJ668 TaxID=2864040 RepID=UPI001C68BC96|nr:hypothetical protein [Chryseobacterium sp. LJ668]MBW8522776.1 hypothetical protein [Chryseobacterium sp. LJ668]QYK16308.1 hypothetical protein K0U91_14800 [Chryseobacterium sp. LJ668]